MELIILMEILKNKQFLRATAILIGGTVGVGIFGIPFAFAKAGFWIGFLFLVLIGLVTFLLNLIYGEIILRTHQSHQLVGYTQLYLGNLWKRVIFFSIILTTYSALLAYVIIAGDFLANIFSSVFYTSASTFSLWFFAIASFFVLLGIRAVAWIELVLAVLLIAVIGLILGFGMGDIDFSNYSFINLDFWFFPYGIFLFAFAGLSAVPIQRQILVNGEGFLKKSILTAVIIIGSLYFVFGWTVLGISGEATSPDAVSGLIDFVGPTIVFLSSLFGVFAVSTSYLMLGTAMLQIFSLDYGLKKGLSWILVIVPPLVLFLGGLRNFIDVISLAGAVAVGLEAFVLIFVFMKSKTHGDRIPEYSLKIPALLLYCIAIIFLGGIGYALVTR